jgi:chemotaxis protein CheX
MDVKFINAFVNSIAHVFKTMLAADVTVGKPALKNTDLVSAEVSGIIGLSGEVQGSVVLSFGSAVACRVASKFAGTDLKIESPDFSDAIGELANMVAGGAKKDFIGYEASISLPSVIIGAGHKVLQSKACPFLVIPCETTLGRFNVEVAIVTARKPAMAGV